MKILVVGGTGTIGQAVVAELAVRHHIIVAGLTRGDVTVDITDMHSIKKMYETIGPIDAVVSTVGKVHFGELTQMTPEQYMLGLHDKLMGQVNLVIAGMHHLNEKGSFTLTSGILSSDPILYGSSASMVNGAIESYAKAAAIELPKGLRINVVSPTVVTEAMEAYGPYFHGFESVPTARVALAYSRSVEGAQTGQVYKVW